MKIWAKIIINHRVVYSIMHSNDSQLDFNTYEIVLREIATKLDIYTPLSLDIHYRHFAKFNIHRYKAADFIEPIYFDYLELEYCSE